MTRALHPRFALMLAPAALALACSSSDDNGSNGSNIGNGASSNGGDGSGNGGSSASTGSGGSSATSGTGGSSTGGGGTGSGGLSGSGGSGTGGGISGSGGLSGSGGSTNVAACSGLPLSTADAGSSCAGVSYEAERIDVDMYIMMDKTVSMTELVGDTGKMRWDFVKEAVQNFVTDPAAANIGVGIQYFNQSGTAANQSLDCDVSRYATPAVEIGLASAVGGDIVNSINSQLPGGFTPLLPAAQGAIQHARDWQTAHPARATVVVLVTDGFPTECQSPPSVSEIANVIAEGYNNLPSIRTYIVGLPAGPNLPSLATAGGTGTAFLIDEGDITASFVSTLLNISNSSIGCEYEIPPPPDSSMQLDYTKVQVVYTPAVGDSEEIPHAQSYVDCANSAEGGWYYDNNTTPTKIQVCPCTCSRLQAGTVEVRLGCEPAPVQIR